MVKNYSNECPYYEMNCNLNNCPCAKYKAYIDVKENKLDDLKILFDNLPNDKFEAMMLLQSQFGKKFCSFGSLSLEDKHKWLEKFINCVSNELDELRDQLPWEKNKDYSNFKFSLKEAKKEIIDMWHFVMSEILVKELSAKDIVDLIEIKYGKNDEKVDLLDKLFKSVLSSYVEETFKMKDYDLTEKMLYFTAKLHSKLEKTRNELNWKHWKSYSTFELNEKIDNLLAETFVILVYLSYLFDMDSNEVYDIYVSKNKENHLRQKNGYNS